MPFSELLQNVQCVRVSTRIVFNNSHEEEPAISLVFFLSLFRLYVVTACHSHCWILFVECFMHAIIPMIVEHLLQRRLCICECRFWCAMFGGFRARIHCLSDARGD